MSKLFGVTHSVENGEAIIRIPKAIKVSIGLPKGPDIHVRISPNGKWGVRIGDGRSKGKVTEFDKMEDARAFYNAQKANVPVRVFPAKLHYFTFSRPGAEGLYEPDWDAIAAHGSMPNQIPIFFVEPDPLDARMEWWSATELRCHGDGLDALRLVTLPQGYEAVAKAAQEAGEKFYPIKGGCAQCGCPYAQPDAKGKRGPCTAKGKLFFQLGFTPIIGVTSFFYTTGRTSIQQLSSCIHTIKRITGRGDPEQGRIVGIPLMLVVKEFRAKTPEGKVGKFFGLHIEFRGKGAGAEIIDRLLETSDAFSMGQPALSAGPVETEAAVVRDLEAVLGTEQAQATAHNSEFVEGEELQPSEEGEDDHELHDDDAPVPVASAPPPTPLPQARQDLSKSQKTRANRVLELAKKTGLPADAIVGYCLDKAGIPKGATLAERLKAGGSDSGTKMDVQLVAVEALSKEELAAELSSK